MRHLIIVLLGIVNHPRVALLGAREFKGSVGMTYDDHSKSESYDSGRELAHMLTLRRYDW